MQVDHRFKLNDDESPATLLGTIWNMIYALFLFVTFTGGGLLVFVLIVIGVLSVTLWPIRYLLSGGAVGFPYL